MVCLALELVGPLVVLGFNVGIEPFDELLSINVPWSQEFSGVLRFGVYPKGGIGTPLYPLYHRSSCGACPGRYP